MHCSPHFLLHPSFLTLSLLFRFPSASASQCIVIASWTMHLMEVRVARAMAAAAGRGTVADAVVASGQGSLFETVQ